MSAPRRHDLTDPWEPSRSWQGWAWRSVSPEEARDLARGVEPAAIEPGRANNELALGWGGLQPEELAERLHQVLALHPGLPDAARLDLCCRFPFRAVDFPFAAVECAVGTVHLDDESGADRGSADDRGAHAQPAHPELPVVGLDNPTVQGPAGCVQHAAGGELALRIPTGGAVPSSAPSWR